MTNNNTKTAELIISGDQHTGSALKLISPVLLNTDPSGRTRFFGIVQSPTTKLFKVIEEIINFSENTNDETEPQEYVDFPTAQLAVESQLETILQNINSRLTKILSKKEINTTISNTNIILGLQNEDALSLAGRGEIQVLLIRPKQNQNVLEDNDSYEILDLMKRPEEENLATDEEELFSHFLSGKFCPEDTLTLSTKNLWEKITEENLLRGIAVLPPSSAVEFIKNNLSKWKGKGATALLLKYIPSEKEPITQNRRLGHSFKNSIEELMGTEKKTEKILSTPTPFKKSLSSFFDLFNTQGQRKIKKYHGHRGGVEKNMRKFFDNLLAASEFVATFSVKLFHRLFLIISNKNNRHKIIKEIKDDFKKGRGGFVKWFNSLPKRSRILFVVMIFVIFVFTQSIFIFNIKQNYENKKETYNNLAQEIKDTTEAAEASLIYGDDRKAEKLLEEAELILAGLSKKTKKEKGEALYLRELLNEKWVKLHHVIDVSGPRLLADLGNTGGKFLIESNGTIYVLSPENASVLKMNPDSGQVNPYLTFENANQAPVFWIQKDNQSAVIFKKNHLPYQTEIQIASAEEISLNNKNIKSIDSSQITERIKDLKIFNDKLYTLDVGQNQVWKHANTSSGFDSSKAWLKEQANLSDGLALALDGSIYILKSDGNLIKLYAGRNTDFEANVPKPIGAEDYSGIQEAKIWTTFNAKFIYVLDQTNNRIIVFDKNGRLVAQYISSVFTNLKDFAVQEKEHKIYVLNDTQIYGIIASHVDLR
ncbi:MAG: hypothetical protein U9P90_00215, partial [Patescibacteria group bacterium]|nr:hypothetical protein [Patescibacteria group bacterium]